MQQVYINKMVGGLKERIENGDETPSILGNILRQGLLKEEEVLLASYTGSKFHLSPMLPHCRLTNTCPQSLLG